MPSQPFSPRLSALLLVAAAVVLPRLAMAAPVQLGIKVIYAHSNGNAVDPKLEKLVKDFSKLSFTAYELKDEATFGLELGSAGRMQLPNGEWMSVRPEELAKDGKLRLVMAIDKLEFKTTVVIAPGATLAVGGPPFGDGALILAVTRLPAAQPM